MSKQILPQPSRSIAMGYPIRNGLRQDGRGVLLREDAAGTPQVEALHGMGHLQWRAFLSA